MTIYIYIHTHTCTHILCMLCLFLLLFLFFFKINIIINHSLHGNSLAQFPEISASRELTSQLCLCCAQSLSCVLLFCDPMDCGPPGPSVHGDSPGKNTGVGCHALLQEIFPTHGSNPGVLQCTWILYCLNHQGRPTPKRRRQIIN